MFNFTLSEILRGRWFVNREWAHAQIPIIIQMLKGNSVNFIPTQITVSPSGQPASIEVVRSGYVREDAAFGIDPRTMSRVDLFVRTAGSFMPNPDLPDDTVGIMPVTGPITKYNATECGRDGAIEKNNDLLMLQRHPKIGSVVLLVDTPGGEARAQESLLPTLKSFGKPIFSYIDGMSASLGTWLTSNTDEVYIGTELGQVGSVGAYTTLFDFSGWLEKEGIKMHEIYAPQSTEKNRDYRDAMDGDFTKIEDDLRVLVDAFTNSVITGGNATRASRAAGNRKKWDAGQLYYAKDAVKYGLADGIRPFSQVISKAAWTAQRKK